MRTRKYELFMQLKEAHRRAEMTFITIQHAERNRLSVHVTEIPQNYTCPLRRQLSALYWAYVYAYCLINELTRHKKKPTLKYCPVLHIWK